MSDPKYRAGDTVKYNGRRGRVSEVFTERTYPTIVWRYYVELRTGTWSVSEDAIEKLVRRKDESQPTTESEED